MVRELERPQSNKKFPQTAPTANPVFYRTYSRRTPGGQETWKEVCDRTIGGLKKLGKLTEEEADLLYRMQGQLKALSSGRWLWVGGTEWIEQPENFSGAYNCSSSNVIDWQTFGLLMDLAMMGCGTGAVLETRYINKLPPIKNRLNVLLEGEVGGTPPDKRREYSETKVEGNKATIYVGDSRQGWVGSYKALLELSTDDRFNGEVEVAINLSDVRPAGEPLKGFGGVANPVKLPSLYQKCADIVNKGVGRQLNSLECCLLIDEAAACIVAGNIRRCIAAGTLVATVDGMKAIEDIKVGDRVLTSSGEYRPAVNKFVQGVQEVVEIRTPAASIRCTANHRVAVYNGLRSYTWKQAGLLQPGDRLISVPHKEGANSIDIDYAWVLGFLWNRLTDGPDRVGCASRTSNINKSRKATATFTLPKRLLQSKLGEKCLAVLKLVGDTPTVSYNRNRGYIRIYREDLAAEFVSSHKPGGDRQIPQSIWQGTPEIRASFLAGLSDADGMPGRNILLHSNQLEFLREVQKLALSLGIATTLSESRPQQLKRKQKLNGGYHGIKIQGMQSEAIAFALINQFAARDRYHIKFAKKKGLSLPYKFLEQVLATTNWQPKPTSLSVTGEGVSLVGAQYEEPMECEGKGPKNHNEAARCEGAIGCEGKTPKNRSDRRSTDEKRSGKTRRLRNANFDTLIAEDLVNPHWLPMEVQFVADAGIAATFDIEVEGDHEFIANGLLVHNSAGMRQGDSKDEIFGVAKDNLWQQGEDGNWRIDPERDALRMSNHTRVFHKKPTREELVEAVRKQFYSGEGAIQWAGESVARANRDLVSGPELKRDFIAAYDGGEAKEWLQKRHPEIEPQELEHRLARVGLNPCGEIIGSNFHCVAGDTLLITRQGIQKIEDAVGQQIEIWNGKRWSKVRPVQTGTNRILYRVKFGDGTFLDVTEGHRFFVKDRFGKEYEELTTFDLIYRIKSGKYALDTEPFTIDYRDGLFVDPVWAYTLGQLVGDGSVCGSQEKPSLQLRLYGAKSYQQLAIAGRTSGKPACYAENPETSCLLDTGFDRHFDGYNVRDLKANAEPLEAIASWNREAILHFIAGLADADGRAVPSGGIRIDLSGGDRAYRIYLLLQKCGIRSSINLVQAAGSRTNLGDRAKDLWYVEITDCAAIPCQGLHTSLGHKPKAKGKCQVIRSIEPLEGLHDTFCFNEPEFHKGVFGGTLTGQCNLAEIHLNQIDPENHKEQEEAFTAGGLSVATLLNHKFVVPRYRYSRELDPIVGVSFTGLFDFFVKAFGVDWLRWLAEGRPQTARGLDFIEGEAAYLSRWREIVHRVVWDYCDRHQMKRPNRCTTVQPSGTKSLLTNASPGWHPPFGLRWVRRITFAKNDAVALACLDYGYSVIPGQSDKDENGNLLDDPFDDRVKEWLVEIPVEVSWIDLPGVEEIAIEKFGATTMFDFYMQVQKHWTTHNTSATILLGEEEVEPLADRIYEAIRDDEGYISAALLARFDAPFPRLPFERISQEKYEEMRGDILLRQKSDDFSKLLNARVLASTLPEMGPQDAACSGMTCELKGSEPMNG